MLTVLADGIELMIIVTATFAQALAGNAPAVNIIGVLVVWRFIVSTIPDGTYKRITQTYIYVAWNRNRGRLPFERCDIIRIRIHQNSWTHDGLRLRRATLGKLQCV